MQRSNTQVDPELQTEPVSQKSGQMQRNSNQNLKERVDGNFEFGISNVGPISAGSQKKAILTMIPRKVLTHQCCVEESLGGRVCPCHVSSFLPHARCSSLRIFSSLLSFGFHVHFHASMSQQ